MFWKKKKIKRDEKEIMVLTEKVEHEDQLGIKEATKALKIISSICGEYVNSYEQEMLNYNHSKVEASSIEFEKKLTKVLTIMGELKIISKDIMKTAKKIFYDICEMRHLNNPRIPTDESKWMSKEENGVINYNRNMDKMISFIVKRLKELMKIDHKLLNYTSKSSNETKTLLINAGKDLKIVTRMIEILIKYLKAMYSLEKAIERKDVIAFGKRTWKY